MKPEIQSLFDARAPLPKGTRINTTLGGWRTAGTHELTGPVLESANKTPNHLSDTEPFWIHGWTDLHDELSIPKTTP